MFETNLKPTSNFLSGNGFLQVLQAIDYFNVLGSTVFIGSISGLIEGLLYEVTGSEVTVCELSLCEETVRKVFCWLDCLLDFGCLLDCLLAVCWTVCNVETKLCVLIN